MTAVSRVSVDYVDGSGLLDNVLVSTVFVNGKNIGVKGTHCAAHGSAPHDNATINQGSSTVFAGGIAVARKGDSATCGDVIETGSGNVFAA